MLLPLSFDMCVMLGVVVEGGEGRLVCWEVEYPHSSLLPFSTAPAGGGHSSLVLFLVCLLFLVVVLVGILCCVWSFVGVCRRLVLCVWWCVVYGLGCLVVVFGWFPSYSRGVYVEFVGAVL